MSSVMNVIFGIGIAIIIFIVVLLGIQVFYEEPSFDSYNCTYPQGIYTTMEICSDNMTVLQCRDLVKYQPSINDVDQKSFEECNDRFMNAQNAYGKNVFIIATIAGMIAIIISLFLFSFLNIAAGIAFSGLLLIFYGFIRGWQGIGDELKFVVALIIAALIIIFAVIVNRRYKNKKEQKANKRKRR